MSSKIDSPVGKEILAYAMNSDDDVVLEFTENGEGEKMVLDITKYVSQLEEQIDA